ncbi:hypothetical protein MBCUT_18490 [Methanobrevibacter cuticularis]|uniref:Uncharacterized protein n=1 Tax=Methanobrevibacter cuticularis TaxID=47311 RepID=A0A166CW02_9EURY|nr:hypothetical protein MBCUT_18490 [Methanobrevibacter cuticularis]
MKPVTIVFLEIKILLTVTFPLALSLIALLTFKSKLYFPALNITVSPLAKGEGFSQSSSLKKTSILEVLLLVLIV